MLKSSLVRLADLCLSPRLFALESRPARIYQARFALVLASLVAIFGLLRAVFALSQTNSIYFSCVFLFSVTAVIAYRFFDRHEFISFLWLLSLLSLQTLSDILFPSLYSSIFAWIPIGIALTCYLAGSRYGLAFTCIALGEVLLGLKYAAIPQPLTQSLDTKSIIQGLQFNLLAAEIIGGIAIYCFAMLRERSEHELAQRRVSRNRSARKSAIRDMVGNLSHELNNPLAIVHGSIYQYRIELLQGPLTLERQEYFRNSIAESYARIERVSTSLRALASDSLDKLEDIKVDTFGEEAQSNISQKSIDYTESVGNHSSKDRDSLRCRPQPKADYMSAKKILKLGARLGTQILYFFLAPAHRNATTKSRSLIAVASVLSATIFEIFNVVSFIFVPPRAVILWSNLALLLVSGLSLASFRRGIEPGKVVPFFVTGYILILAFVSSKCQCFMAPGMYYFPIFLMYGALLSRSRWTILQSISAVAATVFVFTQTTEYGLAMPFAWEVSDYLKRMNSVAVILCFVGFTCMAVQDHYRNRTHEELRLEKEWRSRSSRLFEISTISDGLDSQLTSPVLSLGSEIRRFMALAIGNTSRSETLNRLEKISYSVENLTRVSRSINLMQGASSRILHAKCSMNKLNDHLFVILNEKAEQLSWRLVLDNYDREKEIEGKIASLALLLSTIALRVFEDHAGGSESVLSIQAVFAEDPEDKRVQWVLKFPKIKHRSRDLVPDLVRRGSSYLDDELHESYIRNLLADSGAEIHRRDLGTKNEVVLRGDWFWI